MPQLNFEHPAEELLLAEGLTERRSAQRRALLGCIGCRWAKTEQEGEAPRFYGLELMKCTRIKSGTVYPILRQLTEAGVLSAGMQDTNSDRGGGAPRRLYSPVDSEIGEQFRASLSVPAECFLETIQDATVPGRASRSSRAEPSSPSPRQLSFDI